MVRNSENVKNNPGMARGPSRLVRINRSCREATLHCTLQNVPTNPSLHIALKVSYLTTEQLQCVGTRIELFLPLLTGSNSFLSPKSVRKSTAGWFIVSCVSNGATQAYFAIFQVVGTVLCSLWCRHAVFSTEHTIAASVSCRCCC